MVDIHLTRQLKPWNTTNELHELFMQLFFSLINLTLTKKSNAYTCQNLQNIPKAINWNTLSSTQGTCTWDSCITIRIARTSFPSSGWSHRAKVFRNCVATFGRRVHSETAVASTSFTSKVFYSTKLGGKHVENHPMLSEKLKTWNKLSQKLIQIGFREVLRIFKTSTLQKNTGQYN